MTTRHVPPAERIALMRAKVKAREDREKADLERRQRQDRLTLALRNILLEQLSQLHGLPLSPNGSAHVDCEREDDRWLVLVWRRGHDGEGDVLMERLVGFFVEANWEGAEAAVVHDGEIIDAGVALDLATAAVEARFAE